jgi:hypothetical protein
MRVIKRRRLLQPQALALLTALAIAAGCTAPATTHEPGMVRQQKCINCHETERKFALNPPHSRRPSIRGR